MALCVALGVCVAVTDRVGDAVELREPACRAKQKERHGAADFTMHHQQCIATTRRLAHRRGNGHCDSPVDVDEMVAVELAVFGGVFVEESERDVVAVNEAVLVSVAVRDTDLAEVGVSVRVAAGDTDTDVDCVGVVEIDTNGRGVAAAMAASWGGSATPRNTVPAVAVPMTTETCEVTLYEYSAVAVTAYRMNDELSLRPVMEYTASKVLREMELVTAHVPPDFIAWRMFPEARLLSSAT